MFLVGLELQMQQLRHRARATLAISYTSMVLPFAAGSMLAVYLYPRLASPGVPFVSFTLFLGVAMSITAGNHHGCRAGPDDPPAVNERRPA
jgi:Kef-type K+ transport system membrane component KefB